MKSIKNLQQNPSPEIEYSEIDIPNQTEIGTGKFTIKIKAGSMLNMKLITSAIVNIPIFQLSVNFNLATNEAPILMGRADGSSPFSDKTYQLPNNIDNTISHLFIVEFQRWKILEFKMDGMELREVNRQEPKLGNVIPSPKARIEFFKQHLKLLEQLMPMGWFDNPENKLYSAYKKWEFCKRIISQNGIIKFPEQESELPMFAQILIDSAILITITEGNLQKLNIGSFDKFTKPVKDKILNSLKHPTQFDEILLELSIAAWHLMEKHKAELLQIDGYPDVKVNIPKIMLPLYFECKNITSENASYLQQNIDYKLIEANKQLKSVSESHYGIVVFNVTKPIKLERAKSDKYPIKITEIIDLIKNHLSGSEYSSVGSTILIWDDYMKIGDPPNRTLIAYRRRFERIDHVPIPGCLSVPQNIDLFKGFTSEFSLNWTQR